MQSQHSVTAALHSLHVCTDACRQQEYYGSLAAHVYRPPSDTACLVRAVQLREQLTAASAAAAGNSAAAAACNAAAQTHEEAMKQALAARAALQVTSLAFNSPAGNSSNRSSSSFGNNTISNSQQLLMPELRSNAATALRDMSGTLVGTAGWDGAGSSSQITDVFEAGGYLQQQQQMQMQMQQQQVSEQQQRLQQQQQLAGLQSIVSEGLLQLM